MIKRKPTYEEGLRRFEQFHTKTYDKVNKSYSNWWQGLSHLSITFLVIALFTLTVWSLKFLGNRAQVYGEGDNLANMTIFLIFCLGYRVVLKTVDYDPQGFGGM